MENYLLWMPCLTTENFKWHHTENILSTHLIHTDQHLRLRTWVSDQHNHHATIMVLPSPAINRSFVHKHLVALWFMLLEAPRKTWIHVCDVQNMGSPLMCLTAAKLKAALETSVKDFNAGERCSVFLGYACLSSFSAIGGAQDKRQQRESDSDLWSTGRCKRATLSQLHRKCNGASICSW